MKDKDYIKAFKFLTFRLKDITKDQRARLVLSFDFKLNTVIVFNTTNGHRRYHQGFIDENARIYMDGNCIRDSRINVAQYNKYYSIGNVMKGFKRKDFIKMWLDNAIGNSLYIESHSKVIKFLDRNDTIESLCVQYDMSRV